MVSTVCLLAALALAAYSFAMTRRARRSERKLCALIQSIDYLILVLDDDGRYVEVGPTNRTLLRRPSHELIGHYIHEFFDRDQADFFVGEIRRAIREQTTIRVEYSFDVQGTMRWFDGAATPIGGRRVVWVATDITKRKLAEDARQRAVVEQVHEIIFTFEADGTILSLNPAFERTLGWPVEEWIGRSLFDLIPERGRDKARAYLQSALQHDPFPLQRVIACTRGGSEVALEIAVRRSGGDLIGSARDVTERERAEAALRRSERQLAESQRVAKLGSWEYDAIADTVWWSSEHYRIYGLPPSDEPRSYDSFLRFVSPEQQEHLAREQATLLARGEHAWELRVSTVDGTEKILACNGKTIRNAEGTLLRIAGTLQDVTERKEAERLLRESEERFRLLAQATNDAVWDLDVRSGNVWRGNQYETLFGYKPGEIAQTIEAWMELIHPDDRQRVREAYETGFSAGAPSWSGEYRFRRADGSYASILDRCYIVRDEEKRATRVLGAMMDITERKHLAEQLAQAKRLSSLGRIAASIAHEFNNVLMGMEPNLELIRKHAPPEVARPASHVLSSAFRGKRITEQILRYTRTARPNIQRVSIASLIHDWATDLAPQLGAEVSLSIDIRDDVNVAADSYQLAQVLTNLALNARDAMPDGGTCTITAERPANGAAFAFGTIPAAESYVHIQVRDTGTGMSPEHLAHVFEPLFTTKQRGTGLGLAISYQIVDQHGGMIFAESTPGHGSTFHVLIPALADAERFHDRDAAAPEPAKVTLPLRRVLMVEDEEAVSEGIQALFALDGVCVEVVASGAEAIPAIERFMPDAVVLDIGLPDIDGSELYVQIASRWPCLPVVFSSGHADATKLEQYLKRPTVELLVKPYPFESLQRVVADLVLRSRPSAA